MAMTTRRSRTVALILFLLVGVGSSLSRFELIVGYDADDEIDHACDYAGAITISAPSSFDPRSAQARFFVEQRNAAMLVVEALHSERCGVELADGSRWGLKVKFVGGGANANGTRKATESIAADLMLGTFSSGLNEVQATAAQSAGKLMVTGGASSPSVYAGRPLVFGTLPPTTIWLEPAMRFLASRGLSTLVTLHESDNGFTQSTCGSAGPLAQRLGLTLLETRTIPSAAPSGAVLDEAVRTFAERAPDLVIACHSRPTTCVQWMQQLRANDYVPRAILFVGCVGIPEFMDGAGVDSEYVLGVTPFDSSLDLVDELTGWTGERFEELNTVYTGSDDPPTYLAAAAAAAAITTVLATERSAARTNATRPEELEPTDIAAVLLESNFRTFYGDLSFNAQGQSSQQVLLVQVKKGGVVETIFPASESSGELVYPAPSFSFRACRVENCGGRGECQQDGTCLCEDNYHGDLCQHLEGLGFAVTLLILAACAALTLLLTLAVLRSGNARGRVFAVLGKELTALLVFKVGLEIVDIASTYFFYIKVVQEDESLYEFRSAFLALLAISTPPSLSSLFDSAKQVYALYHSSNTSDRDVAFGVLAEGWSRLEQGGADRRSFVRTRRSSSFRSKNTTLQGSIVNNSLRRVVTSLLPRRPFSPTTRADETVHSERTREKHEARVRELRRRLPQVSASFSERGALLSASHCGDRQVTFDRRVTLLVNICSDQRRSERDAARGVQSTLLLLLEEIPIVVLFIFMLRAQSSSDYTSQFSFILSFFTSVFAAGYKTHEAINVKPLLRRLYRQEQTIDVLTCSMLYQMIGGQEEAAVGGAAVYSGATAPTPSPSTSKSASAPPTFTGDSPTTAHKCTPEDVSAESHAVVLSPTSLQSI